MIDLVPPAESAGLLLAILQGSGFDVAAVRGSGDGSVVRALGVHGEEILRLRHLCDRWAPGTRVCLPAA